MPFGPDKETTSPQFLSKDAEDLLDDANCGTECRMMADDPLLLFALEAEVTVLQRPKDFSRLSNETRHEQLVLSTQADPEVAALKVALDTLRELATQLAGEYCRIQEVAREAEERNVTAVETVRDLEKRLGPLVALQGVDLCAMEMRIAKLKDGDHLLEQTEARLGRLEEMSAETTAQLERREQLRDELGRELRRLETEVQIVTESARRQVAELVNQKKDHSTPIGSVDLSVKPPVLGVGWEELWGSPHRQLTHVMTRLRTRKTIRVIKRSGAGVGLALLALVSFIAMRPFGKTAPLDGKPLPAGIPPVLTISVPVLSGTNFTPDEPRMPRSTTTPSSVDTPPAHAAVRSSEYFGTLAVQSTPARAAVFIDRQQVGETPLQLPQVHAGSHAIWIEREGYKRWTAAVNIPANKITRVIAKLDAEVAR